MYEPCQSTISLWPATPLPASVAAQLNDVGVDLAAKTVKDGRFAARRTPEQTVVLDLTFGLSPYGLTGLEALLATLRLAEVSYVAWDVQEGEIVGTGRAFDRASGIEQSFTMMADGQPVLTTGDLEEFEGRYGTAEALLEDLRSWLRLPTPEDLTDLDPGQLNIQIVPEEDNDLGPAEEAPGCCSPRGREEGR